MNKKQMYLITGLVVVVAAGLIFIMVTNKKSDTHDSDHNHSHTDSAHDETSDQTPVENPIITFSDNGSLPRSIVVRQNATITIVNDSSEDIEFSSADHPTHRLEPELNMATLKPGKQGTIKITKLGTFGYHDHLHASHTGTIKVVK